MFYQWSSRIILSQVYLLDSTAICIKQCSVMRWNGRVEFRPSLQPSQASTYHQTRTSARPSPSELDSKSGSRLRESCPIHATFPSDFCRTMLGMAFLHFSRGTRSLAQMSKSRAGHGQRGLSHVTSSKIWDFFDPLPLSLSHSQNLSVLLSVCIRANPLPPQCGRLLCMAPKSNRSRDPTELIGNFTWRHLPQMETDEGAEGGTFRGASLNHGKRARNALASLDDFDFKIVSLNSYRLPNLSKYLRPWSWINAIDSELYIVVSNSNILQQNLALCWLSTGLTHQIQILEPMKHPVCRAARAKVLDGPDLLSAVSRGPPAPSVCSTFRLLHSPSFLPRKMSAVRRFTILSLPSLHIFFIWITGALISRGMLQHVGNIIHISWQPATVRWKGWMDACYDVNQSSSQTGQGRNFAHLQGWSKSLSPGCVSAEAEVVSKSRNKVHQTWGPPYRRALYVRAMGIEDQLKKVKNPGPSALALSALWLFVKPVLN